MGDFVSYELAQKLESKGFRSDGNYGYNEKGEICVPVYNIDDDEFNTMCSCPEIHEVLKWLRDKKHLYVDISLYKKGYSVMIYKTDFPSDKDYAESWYIKDCYKTYEFAAVAGIEYTVDNLI
jgi:hypothetical protein